VTAGSVSADVDLIRQALSRAVATGAEELRQLSAGYEALARLEARQQQLDVECDFQAHAHAEQRARAVTAEERVRQLEQERDEARDGLISPVQKVLQERDRANTAEARVKQLTQERDEARAVARDDLLALRLAFENRTLTAEARCEEALRELLATVDYYIGRVSLAPRMADATSAARAALAAALGEGATEKEEDDGVSA
jgi:hypothetical protein